MVKGTVAMPFNMKGYYHEGLLSILPSILKDLNRTCPSKENLSVRGRYGDQGDFLILILCISFEVSKLGEFFQMFSNVGTFS